MRRPTGQLGAYFSAVATPRPTFPPPNLAQAQHGFSSANPGPAWSTWDSYPTYIQTQPQPVAPYTAACGQWSAPLGKHEIDGYLYSTAVMMVEHQNGQPVTQQLRDGLYLFALENEMVTVRKCLSPNVPIQQAKFSALAGAPLVGLGDCGPGCSSCPFCKGATHPFGGVVVGVGDSCGHVHPAICLPDPPAFPQGNPCGGPPIPMHYLQQHEHERAGAFQGLMGASGVGTPPQPCCVDLPDPPAFPGGEPCGGPPIPLHYMQQHPVGDAFRGLMGAPGVGADQAAFVRLSPGASAPLPGALVSTAAAAGGPPPPWSYQKAVQPGQTPDGRVTPITYVDVPQQMPLRPPGKMAYQPTLPWWTAWHKDEQLAFDCWWANQQFQQPVCGLGSVANFPATPDFDQLRWVLRMGIPWASEIQCGLAGPSNGGAGSKALEVLAVAATAVGSAVAVVAGLKAMRATTNPRSRPSRAEMIAALGLEPEGRTRGSKYAATTQEFWDKIRYKNSEDAREARRKLGIEG